MNLYVTTATLSDGLIEHFVTDTNRFSDLRGKAFFGGRDVVSFETPTSPAFDAFIDGLVGRVPIWAVRFAMDRDPIQVAVFGTNDASAIVKVLEDYHGEPSRVTWLSINPAKWCLACPTSPDLPQEGSSVPPSTTKTPEDLSVWEACRKQYEKGRREVQDALNEIMDKFTAETGLPWGGGVRQAPSTLTRLTQLEKAVRYLGSRAARVHDWSLVERNIADFVGFNPPESDA